MGTVSQSGDIQWSPSEETYKCRNGAQGLNFDTRGPARTVPEECHASPMAGRLGQSKTLSNVKRRFLWV